MRKTFTFILLCMLVVITKAGNYVDNPNNDSIDYPYTSENSPDNKYQIICDYEELSDNINTISCILIEIISFDTLLQYKSEYRDSEVPVHFWSANKNYLVFETQNNYTRKISFFNLDSRIIDTIINGEFNIGYYSAMNHYDYYSGSFFFYKMDKVDRKVYRLYSLKIPGFKIKEIAYFKTSGDLMSSHPYIGNLDKTKRKLMVEYETIEKRIKEIVIDY